MKKLLKILLASVLIFTGIHTGISAEEVTASEEHTFTVTYDNPLYYDGEQNELLYAGDAEYGPADEATVLEVREYLKQRQTEFRITSTEPYLIDPHDLFDRAMAHTGVPTEGDYLKWQYAKWSVQYSYSTSGGTIVRSTAYFTLSYYTDASQEAEVDTAVSSLLSELNLNGKKPYEKIKAVYDWEADNITYAWDYAENPQNINHTACGAIVRRVCVCQGYAVLFYRLMLELGIDCRLIAGTSHGEGHAWNIVKIGDLYYNIDTTWASTAQNKPAYFLRGASYFPDHTPDDEYVTDEFKAVYPISDTDYDPSQQETVHVTSVSVRPGNFFLAPGTAFQLTAEVLPEDADDKTVVWSTMNASIADVDSEGAVTGIGPGVTQIYVRTNDGGLSAHCIVTVIASPQWAWGDDGTTARAAFIDKDDPTHWVAVDAEVTYEDTPASCTEDGERRSTASAVYNGQTYTDEQTFVLEALGHAWKEPVYTWTKDYAFCTGSAVCTRDSTHTAEETAFGEEDVIEGPTCTEDGYNRVTAYFENEPFTVQTVYRYVQPLGHDWSAWETVKEATCREEGLRQRICGRCQDSETEAVPVKDHEWTDWYVVKEATEEEEGLEERTCLVGGEKETRTIPVLGHTHTLIHVEAKEPGCEEEGNTEYWYCEKCGHYFSDGNAQQEIMQEDTAVEPLGHDWNRPEYRWSDDYSTCTARAVCARNASHTAAETVESIKVVVRETTCTDGGYIRYEAHFTNSLFGVRTLGHYPAPLGHDWGEWTVVKKPTKTEHGLKEHICNRCGASETEEIPAGSIISVESVSLNKSEITLRVLQEETLIATVLPEEAEDKSVTWSCDSTYIALVFQDGKVLGLRDNGIEEPSQTVVTVTTNDGGYTAQCIVKVEDPINAFVRRLYKLCFNRNADAGGFRQWSEGLRSKKNTAAKTVQFFFTSKEYQNLHLTNDAFVEMCYQVMMGRASDSGGKKNWLDKLDAGVSDLYVLKGFVGSKEFKNICADYGITVGEIELTEARDQNLGITQFVSRCYSEVLGRKADKGGLNNWCSKILNASNKKQAAIDMASNGFFHSREYLNKNSTNDEYVRTLYRTFFGREADTGGYNNWMNKLNSGTSRDTVLMGFANSREFANIMAKYGIK